MAKQTTTRLAPATIWRAEMDTDHFSFEAYGATEMLARDALVRSLILHAKQTGLGRDWWQAYDVECQPFTLGIGYRDRSPLVAREAGQ